MIAEQVSHHPDHMLGGAAQAGWLKNHGALSSKPIFREASCRSLQGTLLYEFPETGGACRVRPDLLSFFGMGGR